MVVVATILVIAAMCTVTTRFGLGWSWAVSLLLAGAVVAINLVLSRRFERRRG